MDHLLHKNKCYTAFIGYIKVEKGQTDSTKIQCQSITFLLDEVQMVFSVGICVSSLQSVKEYT